MHQDIYRSQVVLYAFPLVAQLDRAPDFESEGCRFESYSAGQQKERTMSNNKWQWKITKLKDPRSTKQKQEEWTKAVFAFIFSLAILLVMAHVIQG